MWWNWRCHSNCIQTNLAHFIAFANPLSAGASIQTPGSLHYYRLLYAGKTVSLLWQHWCYAPYIPTLTLFTSNQPNCLTAMGLLTGPFDIREIEPVWITQISHQGHITWTLKPMHLFYILSVNKSNRIWWSFEWCRNCEMHTVMWLSSR